MITYQITVEYLGTNFVGWQFQKNGLSIQEVLESALSQYLKENIFSPINMNYSIVYDRTNFDELIMPTHGYENTTPWEDVYLNGVVGDKGIYSTTMDLLKFDRALEKNLLISDSLKNLAFSKKNKDYSMNKNYGYGFRLKEHNKYGNIVYHTGWWKGYRSYYIKVLKNLKSLLTDYYCNYQPCFLLNQLLYYFFYKIKGLLT